MTGENIDSRLAVMRVGLATPLGLSAPASLAAARAGLVRFAETTQQDRRGEPIRASRLGRLDPACERSGRIAALAVWAVHDCLAELAPASPLPLYLAAPAQGGAPVDEAALVDALQIEVPTPLELREVVRGGRAGMFQLLAAVARDAPPLAVVLAADSLCDASTLRRLGERDRVLGSRRDGLIPGEAAGALLLAQGPERPGERPLARITACTLGQVSRDPEPVQALADGLTDVFARLAREPLVRGERPRCVASCQTGEVAQARAFSYAALRQSSLMPEPLVHLRACESFGDTGAAAPALALALALHRLRARSGRALLYGSAEDGALGACVLDVAATDPGATP